MKLSKNVKYRKSLKRKSLKRKSRNSHKRIKKSKRKLVGSGKIKNLAETNPKKYKELYGQVPLFNLDEYGYQYFPKNLISKYNLYRDKFEQAEYLKNLENERKILLRHGKRSFSL